MHNLVTCKSYRLNNGVGDTPHWLWEYGDYKYIDDYVVCRYHLEQIKDKKDIPWLETR